MADSWSDGRVRAFIVSVLRAGTRRWPPKYETLNEAKTEKKINVKTGRMAQHYRCASCQEEFTNKDVQIDHIDPVIPSTGFTSWDDYISRLFCGKDNLQCICVPCHKLKSKEESSSRSKKQLKPPKAPSNSKVRSTRKK